MEPDWLADLYREYRCQLLVTAWTVLRDREAAEDALHSAFVGLVRLPSPPNDPKLYAFKSVRNAALDLLARRARRRERPLELAAELAAPAQGVQDASLLAAVAIAVSQLDEESREVVDLHLRAGLTFQEIAGILGQPLSTVASRYRRALVKLRERLEVLNG